MGATLRFIDEGEATTDVALMVDRGSRLDLAGALSLPRGGGIDAATELLSRTAGLGMVTETYRGGAADLPRATVRAAVALQLPVALLDIGAAAGRLIAARPSGVTLEIDLAEAALAPVDAVERRRRADTVIAAIEAANRAAVTDQLGDLVDAPLRDRDVASDQLRAAATAGAVARIGEELASRGGVIETGSVLIVGGVAARRIADGTLSLATLAPVLPVGRTRVLLEPLGVLAALGGGTLTDERAVELLRAGAQELFLPAGDLLHIADAPVRVVTAIRSSSLGAGEALRLTLPVGSEMEIEIATDESAGAVRLHGGLAGAAIVVGVTAPRLAPLALPPRAPKIRPIAAPIELLPEAPGGGGDFIAARRLLGDEVTGRVLAFDSDPDSRGWEEARAAGILAIAQASPETVLRARAVGVRGLIVGSLSDGEIEALGGSLDRRIAAAVATLPFGLLVLGARRSMNGVAARILERLDGVEVRLSAAPAGLVANGRVVREASDAARDADVAIVGGQHAGRRAHWRGIADPCPGDPIAAVELDGALIGIPFGDLQRLRA